MQKTNISRKLIFSLFVILNIALVPVFTGCEDDDNSYDVGDNDPNLVACVGDSITQGYMCEGAPYPARLAEKIGRTVLNYGVGGERTSYGASVISSVLQRKPGFVCLMLGTNDSIRSHSIEDAKENLRAVIHACKANQTVVLLATIPPMIDSHSVYNGNATRMSDAIRALAKEEGVPLVDISKAFGDGIGYINADGVHLTDAGGDLIASKFAGKF